MTGDGTMLMAMLLTGAMPQAQADLDRRAGGAFRAADAALNVQYRATMAVMARSDAVRDADLKDGSEKPDGDPGYRAGGGGSPRAWLAYRDAQCLAAGFEFRGGSAQGMARGQCLADLTRRRTADLKQMQESFGPK